MPWWISLYINLKFSKITIIIIFSSLVFVVSIYCKFPVLRGLLLITIFLKVITTILKLDYTFTSAWYRYPIEKMRNRQVNARFKLLVLMFFTGRKLTLCSQTLTELSFLLFFTQRWYREDIKTFRLLNVQTNVHFQKFTGNSDTDTVKYTYFRGTFETRFLRIYPKDYNTPGYRCLRFEVYGCSDNTGE